MLTYNDCLGLSALTQEEVAALAQIKHLPEVVALEMGWSLCRTSEGAQTIRRMILDDIEDACRRGDARERPSWGSCCTISSKTTGWRTPRPRRTPPAATTWRAHSASAP